MKEPLFETLNDEKLLESLHEYREYNNQNEKEALLMAFNNFVRHIANEYLKSGLDFNDLMQEGNIAVIKALDTFNPKKGAKLSTYVYSCVKWSLKTYALMQNSDIKLTRKEKKLIKTLNLAKNDLFNVKSGDEPSYKEIVEYLNDESITEQELRKIDIKYHLIFSKNQNLDENGISTRFFLDDNFQDQEIDITINELNEIFNEKLNETEIDVLNKRYGLNGYEAITLQQIADEYGKSKERIRQIQAKAMFIVKRTIISRKK